MAAIQIIKGVDELRTKSANLARLTRERERLLREIFFASVGGTVALVPGTDHKEWRAPSICGYADALAAKEAIHSFLPVAADYYQCAPEDAFAVQQSVIATGSQISNRVSFDVLQATQVGGDPFSLRVGDKLLHLKYNCLRSGHEQIRRRLDDRPGDDTWRDEKNYEVGVIGRNPLRSLLSTDRTPRTGILLFTVLPHPLFPGEKVIVWAGNIGPATEATRLVFEQQDLVTNEDLGNIRDRLANAEYYQVLFDVSDIKEDKSKGRHIAREISIARDGVHPVGVDRIR